MNTQELKNKLQANNYTGITIDSREVQEGNIFVCIKGENTDGHNYIQQAINNKASLIIVDSSYKSLENISCDYIQVPDTQLALAVISNLYFNTSESGVKLFGITGTNGKTSSSIYTAQLFSCLEEYKNINIGLIGTNGKKIFCNSKETQDLGNETGRTTPQAHELHQDIQELYIKYSCELIIMEVSSHALEQKRTHGLEFQAMGFTNLTQDHLDYHLTMENYFQAKAIAFRNLTPGSTAVINLDDKYSQKFIDAVPANVNIITASLKNSQTNLYTENIKYSIQGIQGLINSLEFSSQLQGEFNLYNLLIAVGIVQSQGINLQEIIKVLNNIKPAKGRFERVITNNTQAPACIVDYAHTPDGLENVLQAIRQIQPKNSNNKLICLFGCGGDRDTTKRPLMAQIAEKYSDIVIITSDNPRTEDPHQIIADTMSGINNINNTYTEIDRGKAISLAVNLAKPEDIILLAGKGHEDYQILKNETIHFDDYEQAYNLLNT